MRTIVYIDGFNLYYGRLKHTPYKWLDIKALFRNILRPEHQVLAINYYTAKVSARPEDPDVANHQQAYLDALAATTPELKVHLGHFLANIVRMRLAKPTKTEKFADVIKTEEKGSDVNLAVHLLNDAWLNRYDCAVVCSNDSDLFEAFRIVRMEQKKKILLVPPVDPKVRQVSNQLKQYSQGVVNISKTSLAASQFPTSIPGTKISKPSDW